jgi:outer membrane protein
MRRTSNGLTGSAPTKHMATQMTPHTFPRLVLCGALASSLWLAGPADGHAAPPAGDAPVKRKGDTNTPATAPAPATTAAAPEVREFEDPLLQAFAVQSGGLTADEVARRAVAASPAIAAREAELAAAAAQLDQTLYRFLPSLDGTASYTRLSKAKLNFGGGEGHIVGALNPGPLVTGPCPTDPTQTCVYDAGGSPVGAAPFDFPVPPIPLNSWSLRANLAIPLTDYVLSLGPARKGAIQRREARELAIEGERRRVEHEARIAYYNWLRSVAAVKIAEASVERVAKRLEDAQATFDAGYASKADVLRLDAALANTEAMVIQARNMHDLAVENLRVITGDEAGALVPTVGEDVLNAPVLDDPGALDQLVTEAEQNRLELRTLRTDLEAAENGIRASRADYYPRLAAFAQATYANPNQRFFPLDNVWRGDWAVGLSLSWSLNQTLLTKGRIAEYKANKRYLDTQRASLERGIRLEVTAARSEYVVAKDKLALNQRAAASAEAGYEVVADNFRVGKATATDVLEAELQRITSTLDDINARIDVRVAQEKLRYATGRASQ